MSFEVNEVAPEETSDRVLVTGTVSLRIVALNPSMGELEAMDRKPKEEPTYTYANKTSGLTQTQLDLWLEGDVVLSEGDEIAHVLTKTTFWVEDNQSRGIYIDDFGKFGKNLDKLNASARIAYNGEIDVVQFLKALCNLGQKEKAKLNRVGALAKGDLSELQGIISKAQKNRVQVLLGVRDSKYQDVFSKQYDFAYRTNNAYLHKNVVRQADYERTNGKDSLYFGPINVFNDEYKPSAYLARRYSPEAQEAFQNTLPKGSFGAGPGGPSLAFSSPAATAPNQPFGTEGAFAPKARFPGTQFQVAPRPQPQLQPISSLEDNNLPL